MKKLCLLFIILLVVGGCSEKEEIGQLTNKYEKQLDENQKVIQEQQKAIKD
ncbi:hypothetical protein [Psychrobacillus sp. NPDC093200]|uniref:hypothetical protein n=1 Tax=Psychrobacillus sp. NPDC093200 TaxID=3390656 RepID=UPI003D038B47